MYASKYQTVYSSDQGKKQKHLMTRSKAEKLLVINVASCNHAN